MQKETDLRALVVVERALHSANRATRQRAVAMLARLACESRMRWLEDATHDRDAAVRDTAVIVLAWVVDPAEAPWPDREDSQPDSGRTPCYPTAAARGRSDVVWQWEYVVEVWRDDGMLVGSYLAATCNEDDEHAKRIALGQAILASVGPGGDAFEPDSAAAFIVAKRQVQRADRPPRGRDYGQG